MFWLFIHKTYLEERLMSILQKFFAEGEVIAAIQSGNLRVDPVILRAWAREKGFPSVEAFAERRVEERNAFIDLLCDMA